MVDMAEAVEGILDMEGGEANAVIVWRSPEDANFVVIYIKRCRWKVCLSADRT
jgi:hypothetical protein